VTDLEVGDHVVMLFVPGCGNCLPCAEGRPVLCEPAGQAGVAGTLLSGARRLSRNGQPISHFVGVSAFAEHAVLSRRGVHRIDKSVPLELAALFGCAVMTGVGAVANTARVQPGQSVAVVGLGGVGLSAVMGAAAAGAARVVAMDLHADKLAMARDFGATHTVNAGDEDAVRQVRALTDGGVDHAFEMVGSARALEMAYRITRRGGQTVTAGLPSIGRYLALHAAGRLPVERLVTGHLTLDQINEGFDRLARGEAIRQIIRMGCSED
jgi:alcohol dehydrogenase